MVHIRRQQEIIQTIKEYLRTLQPNLDTKDGTVAGDLFVSNIAVQIAKIYEDIQTVSNLQSIRFVAGQDLDRLGSNFSVVRGIGTKAAGSALLTWSSMPADIPVSRGSTISARNGQTFVVRSDVIFLEANQNTYKAIASQYRSDLDSLGITDTFAAEILVEAAVSGEQGNISKYSLTSTSITSVSNVTNISTFNGGTFAESDANFRNRIIGALSSANTGTAVAYKNVALADNAVIDAVVIEPGDDLMIRDGTVVFVSEDGTRTIVSEGTGGKVDIYIFGLRLTEILDSYIYLDKSNTGDPTNVANNFVLGQIDGDENKTLNRKRLDNLASGNLPDQPVNNILQVLGSASGGNFIEKTTDSLGRVSGNYELLKDTGSYAGSVWGFDKLHWISDRISNFPEDKTKGTFNGQDSLGFSDVTEIVSCEQRVSVTNENSSVSQADRSIIQLKHYPIINISRVFNLTTGETYIISNQNVDGTGPRNATGRIKISGSSLPGLSDTLQVDYTWVKQFDPNFDFDNRYDSENLRSTVDSVDWGYSNNVAREEATIIDTSGLLTVTTEHPISAVVSVNKVTTEYPVSVTQVEGRLAVIVPDAVENVVSVIRDSDGADIWNTSKNDGSFRAATIFLPTDQLAQFGDVVTVVYNANDIYNTDGYNGSFSNNTITIATQPTVSGGDSVEVNYIANINILVPPITLSELPLLRNLNSFNSKLQTDIGTQPSTYIYLSNEVFQNLRKAPSNIGLQLSGSISKGTLNVRGDTIYRVISVVPVGITGLNINLYNAIQSAIGLNSNETLPSNVRVGRVISTAKVTTTNSLDVLSTDFTYDIKQYQIQDNDLSKDDSVKNVSLQRYEFTLPASLDNLSNVPTVGDRLQIEYYYVVENDSENVSFSQPGLQYTQKSFINVESISISSGFTSAASANATLTVTNLNQPKLGSRYRANYDYLAPKSNERISIRYNLNQLVGDVQLAVENTRMIGADVLVKEATAIPIDVTLNVVVTKDFTNSSATVQENVKDVITTFVTQDSLGTTLDSSDLIAAAYGVTGVDRVRVLAFNRSGQAGQVLSITAGKNEYIESGVITINIETR